MNHRLRAVVCILVVSALVAGCGGGGDASSGTEPDEPSPPDPAPAGELVVDGVVVTAAFDAAVAEFEALDSDARLARAIEASRDFERQQYEAFGLTAALGGAAAADASIEETAQWMAALGTQITGETATASLEPQGLRRAPSQATTADIGEGMFGGLMVTMLGGRAVISATNDGTTGERELASGFRVKVGTNSTELTSDVTFTDKEGVTTTLKTRNAVTPCPKADGTFEATISIDTSGTVNGGATGQRGTFDVMIKGTVDDNAELVGHDTTYRGQFAQFADRKGGFIDLTGKMPAAGGHQLTVNRGGGTITDGIVKSAVYLALTVAIIVGNQLVEASEEAWKSGRCVLLEPTVSAGPKGLTPGSPVTITAAPRSKVDKGPVGGSVTATLTGGAASVSPAATKVPADATFTYVAPSVENETGEVSLEARSRRGIGTATINFDTKPSGYIASGGGGGISISGTIADLSQPFTTEGVFTGGSTTFKHTPTASRSGTISISSPCGPGCVLEGTGTYTIAENDDGTLLMTEAISACTTVTAEFSKQVCMDSAPVVVLTPIG